MNIRGKKILITGGTTGIGRETSLLLNKHGAKILTFGREKTPLDEVIAMSDNNIIGCNADVSKSEDLESVFNLVDEHLGGLDVLINNAGVGGGNLIKESTERLNYLLETNLHGYVMCTKYALERMHPHSHIINIGSMSTEAKDPGSEVYVATKSAIRAFTDSLRKSVNEKGVRLTVIEPGAVYTDLQEKPKAEKDHDIAEMEMLQAKDIAQAVLFCLTQPERSEITLLQIKPVKQII
jgi:NADP-dependent 3-hydroxy acid dehydrogenase YdfG